ncbi:hypothetical protein KP509_19G076800 [Ceratopteris richardii]|nr:hypothetical protein KP509_19G076800 [Ceratopteris richardii]
MNSYIIKRELLRTKKGKTFFSEANRAIQGFKMSLTEDQVSDVSKMDSYMLHLYWTMEKLNTQINALDEAYNQSKQSAIRALNHNRTIAKRHVHRMHIVKTSKQKCWEFQGKLQEVLLFISQAETTKQVSEALRLGTDALKEHLIPLEDIEECMNEIDAAVLGHAEVNQVLASPLNSMQVEDFESELTNLELELLNGESEASSVVVPSTASEAGSQEQQSRPSTASVDAIEQSMKRIALA